MFHSAENEKLKCKLKVNDQTSNRLKITESINFVFHTPNHLRDKSLEVKLVHQRKIEGKVRNRFSFSLTT